MDSRYQDTLIFKHSRQIPLSHEFIQTLYNDRGLKDHLSAKTVKELYHFVPELMGNLTEAFLFGRLLGIKLTDKGPSLHSKHKLIDILTSVGIIQDYRRGFSILTDDGVVSDLTKLEVGSRVLSSIDPSKIDVDQSWSVVVSDGKKSTPLKTKPEDHRVLQTAAKKFQKRVNIPIRKFRRVFNAGMGGGRIYSNYQQMAKDKRSLIRIDGKETIEIDFMANQIRMLLFAVGEDFIVDPYEGFGIDRKEVKKAFNVLMNSDRPLQVFCDIRDCGEFKWPRQKAVRFMEQVKDIYPALNNYWGSGVGKELQRIEGDISIDIMREALYTNLVVLPIHDSFIIDVDHSAWLKKQMDKYWVKNLMAFRESSNL